MQVSSTKIILSLNSACACSRFMLDWNTHTH